MLLLLGLQIPICKLYPKGRLSLSVLKSARQPAPLGSLQCKRGTALLGGYRFPPRKGNLRSKIRVLVWSV